MTERKRETLLSRKGKEKYFHKGKGESEGKEDNRGCCLLSPQVEGRGRTWGSEHLLKREGVYLKETVLKYERLINLSLSSLLFFPVT